jgi:uncharacterized protein YjbI with pentapeptide repeats
MSTASFNAANFTNAILPSNIANVNFQGATLTGANFSNVTNLSNVNFGATTLTGIDFSGVTNIAGANFNSATSNTGVDFGQVVNSTGADFCGVTFSDGIIVPPGFTGCFGNIYYNNGQPTSIPGNGTGWSSVDGIYYVNTVATTLPESGTGWYSNNNVYYVSGVATDLPESGSGWSSTNSIYYISGEATVLPESGTGWDWQRGQYALNGVWTALSESGTGWVDTLSVYYLQGTPTTLDQSGTGWEANSNAYFINGMWTSLNDIGTGFDWNSWVYYINGQATTLDSNGNGWMASSGVFYVNGVATELDSSGTGIWNNTYYGSGYVYGYIDPANNLVYYDSGFSSPWFGIASPMSSIYYIAGAETTLDYWGYGWDSNSSKYYLNGQATTLDQSGTGFDSNWGYFNNGCQMPLDSAGNGWDNWCTQTYYIGGVQMPGLDSDGRGFSNNKPYWNGSDSNLDGANFDWQYWGGSDFSAVTSMVNAQLRWGNYDNVDFSSVTNMTGADFYQTSLQNIKLPANIAGASFNGANLYGADFSSVTDMNSADLSSVDLSGRNFSSVNISGTNFTGATMNGCQLPDGTTGYYGNRYFINGQETDLNEYGNGFWNGDPYSGGVLFTDGYFGENGLYYIGGVEMSGLDSNGSGFSMDTAYYYGTAQPTGWNDYYYYINNEQTLLDSGGNSSGVFPGDWNLHNGKHYRAGVPYTGVLNDGSYTIQSSKKFIDGVPAAGYAEASEIATYTGFPAAGFYDENGFPVQGWFTVAQGAPNTYNRGGTYFWSTGNGITTLDSNGNGWDNVSQLYYNDGVMIPGLDQDGVGYYNNLFHSQGQVYTGEYADEYFQNGERFTGDAAGRHWINGYPANGDVAGRYYSAGYPATGVFDGRYWVDSYPANGDYGSGRYYNDGYPLEGLVDGRAYSDGYPLTGEVAGRYYNDGYPFNGDDGSGRYYNDGYPLTGEVAGRYYNDGYPISGIWNNKPYWDGSPSNLNGGDFSNQDLSTIDFSEVRSVVGANFSNSTLDNIGYGHNGQTYPNSTVPAYLLEGANFYGATLKNCYITGYTQGTSYYVTYFENCDIGGDFSNADLQDVRFVSSRLHNANFGGANLSYGSFTSTQSSGTTDFTGANYSGSLTLDDSSIVYLTPARGFTFTGENMNFSSSTSWFINGVATTLCPGGDGIWNDVPYFSGTPNPTYTGWAFGCRVGSAYYINGVVMPGIDESGNGESGGNYYVGGLVTDALGWWVHSTGGTGDFEGVFYAGGSPLTGWWADSGTYYVNGVAKPGLDESGTGVSDGVIYINGSAEPLFTGWLAQTATYYIAGVAKVGLDETGSGVAGGQTYVNGVVQNNNGGGGNNLPPNYKGVWDNFTYYGQDDIVSLNGQYWILSGLGGWTVGGAPGLGYGWTRYGTSLVRVSGRGRFLGRVKFAS